MEPATFIGVDARIWQAVIAGGVVALGWLVNGWSQRREERRQRRERLRDVHKALFAEIRDVCAAYWLDGRADAFARDLIARMKADPDFVPFIPRETHGVIYREIVGRIDVLPRQTIDWIVAFYAIVRSIEAMAEDMRGDRFAGLEADRRIAIYEEYIAMRARAFAWGQQALRLIEVFSDGGPEAAERMVRRVSNPGAGRSAPASRDGG